MATKKIEKKPEKKEKTLKLGNYECPSCNWIGTARVIIEGFDRCPKCNYFVYPTDKV